MCRFKTLTLLLSVLTLAACGNSDPSAEAFAALNSGDCATAVKLFDQAIAEAPDDAARHGLSSDDPITVRSRRGEMQAKVEVTSRVSEGLVFANFHFPAEQNANNLTNAALDPVAKIPEYKVCAVRLEIGH